jgi:carbon-monoxide dehydrogenase small subunit
MRLTCTINGEVRQADDLWEGESLLYVLRERLGLPGSKNACEQGECGSCSVYLDGTLVCACLVLAGQAEGSEIVTVEGLAEGDALHPLQEAFVEAGAVQCGFCTPGLVVATHDLLRRQPSPTDAEIREALAGNLCRCTGYEKILDAVRLAVGRGVAPAEGGGVWTAARHPSGPRLPSHPGAPITPGRGDARPSTGEGGLGTGEGGLGGAEGGLGGEGAGPGAGEGGP